MIVAALFVSPRLEMAVYKRRAADTTRCGGWLKMP
jgi:hypothetical protein